MNERIKKLAEQAGGEFYTGFFGSPNSIKFKESDLEKFAEFLVKECMQSIEKTIDTNCDTDSEKMGCEFAITDLLEHFGVEQ